MKYIKEVVKCLKHEVFNKYLSISSVISNYKDKLPHIFILMERVWECPGRVEIFELPFGG